MVTRENREKSYEHVNNKLESMENKITTTNDNKEVKKNGKSLK
jgi:hypothetical protein